jgi:uncharacterized delta-60 repeat protein
MIHSAQDAALPRWRRVAHGAMVALLVFAASTIRAQAPGTLDTSFGGGSGVNFVTMGVDPDGWRGVAVQPDGKIVAAGTCVSSTSKQFCLARFAADGSLDTGFGTGGKQFTTIGTANATAIGLALQSDGKIVVAGSCGATNAAVFCVARYLANGALDTSGFGLAGVFVAPAVAGITNAVASGMAQLGDGKIIIAGTCGRSPVGFCVGRFTSAGALDTSFATTGIAAINVGSDYSIANAMLALPDGAVVLGGQCLDNIRYVHFCLVRFIGNGNVDTSFGSSGTFVNPMIGTSGGEILRALALQPDGKIVMGGQCFTTAGGIDFCLARASAAGAADASFGTAGNVTLAVAPVAREDRLHSLQVMPDGRIVSVGGCVINSGGWFDLCAARHNTDGSVDASFGTGGKFSAPLSAVDDLAFASAQQLDGKLLLAGRCISPNGGHCIARYHGGPFGYRHCTLDVDGDGSVLATTDALIHARIALGMTGAAVTNGITFGPTATRTTWSALRTHLITRCGMTLP